MNIELLKHTLIETAWVTPPVWLFMIVWMRYRLHKWKLDPWGALVFFIVVATLDYIPKFFGWNLFEWLFG